MDRDMLPVVVTISYDLAQAYPGNTFPVTVSITPGPDARIRSVYGLDWAFKRYVKPVWGGDWTPAWSGLGLDFCVNVDKTEATAMGNGEMVGLDSVEFLDLSQLIAAAVSSAAGSGGSGASGITAEQAVDEIGCEFVPHLKLNLTGGLKVVGKYVKARLLATGACNLADSGDEQFYGKESTSSFTLNVSIPQQATPGSLINFAVNELEYHFDVYKGLGVQLTVDPLASAESPLSWQSTGGEWAINQISPDNILPGGTSNSVVVPIPVQNSPWDLAISNVFYVDEDTGKSYYASSNEFFNVPAGKPVTFGLKVNNLGWNDLLHQDSDTRAVAALYVDGTNKGTVRVCDTGGFPTGQEQTVMSMSGSWTVSLEPGYHLVQLVLDPEGKISDLVQENNVASYQFFVYGHKGSLQGEIYKAGTNYDPVPAGEIERVVLDCGYWQYTAIPTTDQLGNTWYSFRDVWVDSFYTQEPFSYNLSVIAKPDSTFTSKTVPVSIPVNDWGFFDVSLDQEVVLKGTVKDSSNRSLPDAVVKLAGGEGKTDSNGYYEIRKLKTGTYDVRVAHPLCSGYQGPVTLNSSENTLGFTLDPYYDDLQIHLNNDAPQTGAQQVSVTFTGRPPETSPVAVRLAEAQDGLSDAEEITYPADDRLTYQLSEGEGEKTVYAQFKDPYGGWWDPVAATIVLDGTGPAGTVEIGGPEGDGETDSVDVTLTLQAQNVSTITAVELSNDNVHWRRLPMPVNGQLNWTLGGGGLQTVYARFIDQWGNVGTVATDTITVSYPATLILADGAAYTNSAALTAQFLPGGVPVAEQLEDSSGGDFGLPSDQAAYPPEEPSPPPVFNPYKVAQPFILSEDRRVSGVSLALTRTADCASNVTLSLYQSLEGTPLATVTVGQSEVPLSASPAYLTANFSETVNLPAGYYYLVVQTNPSADNHYVLWGTMDYDAQTGPVLSYNDGVWSSATWGSLGYNIWGAPPYMRFSLDGTFDTEEWHEYAPESEVTLGGEGERTVKVQSGDVNYAVINETSARIFVDTVAPAAGLQVRGYTPGTCCPSRTLTVDLTAEDNPKDDSGGSGVEAVRISYDGAVGDWEPFAPVKEVTLPDDGSYTLTFEVRDRAGNVAAATQDVQEEGVGYPASEAVFSWAPAPHISGCAGYSLAFDQQSDTVPDESVDTTETTTSYPGLTPGEYYFHLRALDGAGHWSDAAHYGIKVVALLPPSNLQATAGDGQVSLSWTASPTEGVGYYVYRRTEGTSYGDAALNSTPLTGTSYTDTTVVNGTTYYYVVKAVDGRGNLSEASNEVAATPQAAPTPPISPPASTDTSAGGGTEAPAPSPAASPATGTAVTAAIDIASGGILRNTEGTVALEIPAGAIQTVLGGTVEVALKEITGAEVTSLLGGCPRRKALKMLAGPSNSRPRRLRRGSALPSPPLTNPLPSPSNWAPTSSRRSPTPKKSASSG
ncbi:MAG: carboxypeptidase regulatory-like domain-containing protein [Desulfotomaculales bacterium]